MKIEELNDKQFIQAVRECAEMDCSDCEYFTDGCDTFIMLGDAANRIEELMETVEQKTNVSRKTPENPGEKQEPAKATEYISISLEEYTYLRNLDVLMDILLGDGDYSTFRNVVAVRQSIRDMKQSRKVAAHE